MKKLKQEIMNSDEEWDLKIFDTPFNLDQFSQSLPAAALATNTLYNDLENFFYPSILLLLSTMAS